MKFAKNNIIISSFAIFILFLYINRAFSKPIGSHSNKNKEVQIREAIAAFLKNNILYGYKNDLLENNLEISICKIDEPNYVETARCKVGKITMRIELNSLKIVQLENGYLKEKKAEIGFLDDNRTKEYRDMVPIVKLFVEKILGPLPKNVRLDETIASSDFAVTRGDVWCVKWVRYAGDYPYQEDSIVVHISEQYGILDYRNSLGSNEVNLTIEVLSDAAICNAKKHMKDVIDLYNKNIALLIMCDPIDEYRYDCVLIPEKKPCVVNIGRLMPWEYVEDRLSTKKKEAVLAWPVTFDSKKDGKFIIYINSKDGKYVGFYYYPHETNSK